MSKDAGSQSKIEKSDDNAAIGRRGYPVNLLPDQAAADIYAFLQTLPGRRPVKDIPILNNN